MGNAHYIFNIRNQGDFASFMDTLKGFENGNTRYIIVKDQSGKPIKVGFFGANDNSGRLQQAVKKYGVGVTQYHKPTKAQIAELELKIETLTFENQSLNSKVDELKDYKELLDDITDESRTELYGDKVYTELCGLAGNLGIDVPDRRIVTDPDYLSNYISGVEAEVQARISKLEQEKTELNTSRARKEAEYNNLEAAKDRLSDSLEIERGKVSDLEAKLRERVKKPNHNPIGKAEITVELLGYIIGVDDQNERQSIRRAFEDMKLEPEYSVDKRKVYSVDELLSCGSFRTLVDILSGYLGENTSGLDVTDASEDLEAYCSDEVRKKWSPNLWKDDRQVSVKQLSLAYRSNSRYVIERLKNEGKLDNKTTNKDALKLTYKWGDIKDLFPKFEEGYNHDKKVNSLRD